MSSIDKTPSSLPLPSDRNAQAQQNVAGDTASHADTARTHGDYAGAQALTRAACDSYQSAADMAATSDRAKSIANDAASAAQTARSDGDDADSHRLSQAALYAYKRAADIATNSQEAMYVAGDASNAANTSSTQGDYQDSQVLTQASTYATQKAATLPAPPPAPPEKDHFVWYNPLTWF